MWRIDRRVAEPLPVLVDLVKNSQTPVQKEAIKSLEGMGPEAREALPALIEAAQNRDLRVDARGAIRKIQSAKGPGGHRAARQAISEAKRAQKNDDDEADRKTQ
jgi:hypothetical protein